MLGENIDNKLVEKLLTSEETKRCMPDGWDWEEHSCQCFPKIAIEGASRPYADRLIFVGDCGMTRLYKDGIGAAYRTAKAAASTAIFERQPRSATVRALGQAKILTVDLRNFLRRVQEDPSLAFRILETLSHRVRDLNEEVGRLRSEEAARGAGS